MRRLKTGRRPPIYPKTPGHLPCSSLTHPLPLSSRRPSVSFGGFGLRLALAAAGLVISALVSSLAFADFSLSDWRYVKPIILPGALPNESLVELSPDTDVFTNSSPGLADLRIIAGDGIEVPYKFEVSRGERQRSSFSVSLRDRGYVPGQYTTFMADLGQQGVLHNEIEIHTRASNFRRSAVVEASTDGATWARVAEQRVYDFTVAERGFSTRDTRVKYTDTTARYLRVQIADEGEGPLDIAGATVFFVKESAAREVRWSASMPGVARDIERRATVVHVDLGAPGLPSHRLEVRATDVNFYREVELESSFDGEEWRNLTRAAIYAYDTPKFVGNSLVVRYPETASRYLRLVVYNEDNPPVNIQGVDVWGLRRRLVFSADPNQSYKLYYGNAEARRPSYDIERVLPYLATEDLFQASLGPHAESPRFLLVEPPLLL